MDERYADILIRIRAYDVKAGGYPVEAKLSDGSEFSGDALQLDPVALRKAELELDPVAYGLHLFDALFAGKLGRAYSKIAGMAEAETADRLRVRLQIDPGAAELHALDWERIYHYRRGQEVALAATGLTPFSRYTGLEEAEPAPVDARPLHLLFAIANPDGMPLPAIDVPGEVEALHQALDELRQSGRFRITVMPGHTGLSRDLRERLQAAGVEVAEGSTTPENILRQLPDCHIFHFLGHGSFERVGARGGGVATLHLEDEQGRWLRWSDSEIADRLAKLTALPHLIFLAACDTARRPEQSENPFVGLGPKLVAAGVPAVVAMQDVVPMPLARRLTGDFYHQLLTHGVVDRALNEARNLVFRPDGFDWAIPVLFMRLKDGQLIDPAFLFRPPCPYPGMRPFTVKQGNLFFGRDAEIGELQRRLHAEPLIAVIGPSGSGKSSLVMAGLLPRLDPKQWTIRTFEPGAAPPGQLRKELEGVVDVDTGKRSDGGATQLLVVVDQLEQIFTATTDQAQRDGFMQDLLRLMTVEKVRIVLTMRSDFYDDLENSVLWSAVERRDLALTLPKGDRLREAIVKPAASVGVTVEPALVERLASEAGEEPGTLPFVQETLTWLWEDLEGRELTLRAYEEMVASAQQTGSKAKSGLQMAMALHADKAYNAFKSDEKSRIDERRIAERILLRLVQLQDVERLTRRRQTIEELIVRPDEDVIVKQVLDSLRKEHLITLSGDESGKEVRVDLSHEALVRGWSPLAEWVIKRRDDELFRRELEEDAAAWRKEGEGFQGLRRLKWLLSSDLYRGAQLRKARDWATRDSADVDGGIGVFLGAAQSRTYAERAVLSVLIAALMLAMGIPLAQKVQVRRWQQQARGPAVILPAGPAMFGQPPSSQQAPIEEGELPPRTFPETTLTLPALAMDQYEVSYDRYRLCVRAGTCTEAQNDPEFAVRPGNLPVVNITAFQAGSFCRWISGRLPTEVEWERAVRGSSGRAWPWGDEPPTPDRANVAIDGFFGQELGQPAAVDDPRFARDATPAPEAGIMHLLGNVAEWTSTPLACRDTPYACDQTWDNVSPVPSLFIRGMGFRDQLIPDDPVYGLSYSELSTPDFSKEDLGFRCIFSTQGGTKP